jgi:hypothetical protein
VPMEQLVPALARKLGLPEGEYDLVAEWAGPLAVGVTLAEAGIAEGGELQLRAKVERRRPEPAAPPVELTVTREDVEAVAPQRRPPPRAAPVQRRPKPITPPAPTVAGAAFRSRYLKEEDPLLGQACVVCYEPFVEGAELVVCPACGALYHYHCWKNQGFRCAQAGCGGQGQPGRPRDWGRVQLGGALATSGGVILYVLASLVAGEAGEESCLAGLALLVCIAGLLTLVGSWLASKAAA